MPNALRIGLTVLLILILALLLAVTVAKTLFNRQTEQASRQVLNSARLESKEIVQASDLVALPACVRKWLVHSGVVGQPKIHTVRLIQKGSMRSAADKPWMPVEAVQYINVDQPGFVWKASSKMAPLLFVLVRDRYYQGEGSMLVKLLGIVPVVNAKPGMEMNQGALLRYLAEMIWYPTAALNDYMQWEEIDAHTARATMTWQGVSASTVFTFNEEGDLISTLASRYQEINGQFVLNDWGGVAGGYRIFNGMRIQNKSDVIWKYKTGDFNWLQLEITDIDYNQSTLY